MLNSVDSRLGVVRKRFKRTICRDCLSATHHHHHEEDRNDWNPARRPLLQPLEDGAQRQQRDRTYGRIGKSIGEGMWVANGDGMPPKHESARALRVEPDNACRLTPPLTQTNDAQRVAVRMPFEPPRPAVHIPGAVTESALLVPIITWYMLT
jgi:hypothetical protein